MWKTSVWLLAVVAGGEMIADHQTFAGPKRRGAMIVSPKREAEVGRTHEVIGKLHVPGQPVVLVRPQRSDGVWWIQPPPTLSERGYFKTGVRFGSAASQRGDRFALVVIVLQMPADIEYLRERESITELPETIWQSEEVPVVLGDDAPKNRGPILTSVAVLKPQPDQKVTRLTELIGRGADEIAPIVLVRADDIGGLWWVQNPVAMGKGGYFKSTVRFGNDATPNGTRFRVLVVTPRSREEAAGLKTGNSMADLPNGIPRSTEVLVTLERPDTKRVAGAE